MTYLWSKQKGRHLADNILKYIFLEGIFYFNQDLAKIRF